MVVVVYRKSEKSSKKYMKIFKNDSTPDRILSINSRKPAISNEYVIDEIGVGTSFINYYKTKLKIKNHEVA